MGNTPTVQSVIKDPKFLALGDDDQVAVLKHLQSVPGTPEGLPGVPTPKPDMQESQLAHAVTGPPLTGMQPGMQSPATDPLTAKRMQQGAAIGGLVTSPAATVGALAGGYGTGKVAKFGARSAGLGPKGQDIAEHAGNLVGGVGGGMLGDYLPAGELVEWGLALTSPRKFIGKVADTFLERLGTSASKRMLSRAASSVPKPPKPEPSQIVSPDAPPPHVPVTYQSYPREQLYEMAKKGDIAAGLELIRSPKGFQLPPNFKYLIEGAAKRIPWRASGSVTEK